MPKATQDQTFSNWVDPDVVAYYEATGETLPVFNPDEEATFKRFFDEEWQSPNYDDLRERWEPLITDADPYGRLYGKTALWSLVQLRRLRSEKMSRQIVGHLLAEEANPRPVDYEHGIIFKPAPGSQAEKEQRYGS